MIVSLSGLAGAGKDTAAKHLVENYGFTRVAFADKIKELLVILDPLIPTESISNHRLSVVLKYMTMEEAKNYLPEVRRLLQVFGTEVGRDGIDKDIWVNQALAKVEDGKDYVFTDTRFDNEFRRLRDLGATMVNIQRTSVKPPDDHISEKSMQGQDYDIYVMNSGTPQELGEKLVRLLKLEDDKQS